MRSGGASRHRIYFRPVTRLAIRKDLLLALALRSNWVVAQQEVERETRRPTNPTSWPPVGANCGRSPVARHALTCGGASDSWVNSQYPEAHREVGVRREGIVNGTEVKSCEVNRVGPHLLHLPQ